MLRKQIINFLKMSILKRSIC